jgi:hypothetical protein
VLTVLASSTEYVFVPVSAMGSGSPVNPVGDVVQFAFLPGNTAPGTASFVTGTWFSPIANTYYAACLVGPLGSASLTPGTYTIWVKITDNPEVPVRTPGQLQVQ